MIINQQDSEWYFTPLPLQHISIIFFRAWINNIIQNHSRETGRPRDFVARSVATRPPALKLASLTFKKLWEVNLSQVYQRSNTDFCVHVVV